MRNTVARANVLTDLTIQRITSQDTVQSLLEMFSDVAVEERWQPGDYFSTVPTGSIHFAIYLNEEIIGGVQVVVAKANQPFSCQKVWPEAVLPKRSAHITVLAVKKEYRGNIELFWILGQQLFDLAADNGIRTYILEATPQVYAIYRMA